MARKLTKQESKNFVGEVYKNGAHIGNLFRVDGGYKIIEINYGQVLSESDVMHGSQFKRNGGLQLSASQYVRFYELAA